MKQGTESLSDSDAEKKRKWDSKSHGTKFGHHFFYTVIRFGGRKVAYFFLYFIAFNYAILFPSIRKQADPYLKKRFPQAGWFALNLHRYRLILHFGRVLIDRAIVGILGTKTIDVAFENPDRILDIDGGFVLLISHAGGWQVAMAALDVLDKPVNFLMLRDEKDIDKHYYEHENGEAPIKIINPDQFLGGSIEVLNALKKDEIVCMMGDRVFNPQERTVDIGFLGKKTQFPISAFKMASLSKTPVVVLYSHKSGSREYGAKVAAVIKVPPKIGKKAEGFLPYVQAYVTSLEAFITDHPYQFFNFFDMWEGGDINENG